MTAASFVIALILLVSEAAPGAQGASTQAIQLMSAPTVVTRACTAIVAASRKQHASWRVVCPPLVPSSRLTTVEAGGISLVTDYREGYRIDGSSPSGDLREPHNGHWTFAAGAPNAVHSALAVKDAACRPLVTWTRKRATLGEQSVWIYRVPTGDTYLSDHVVVEWTWQGEAYQVSVHRWQSDRQGYVMATKMAAAIIRLLR